MAEPNPPLAWEDFSALAPWLAFEISGAYIMDKKSYKKNMLDDVPFHFHYREPVRLCHEETTLFALFIKQIFRCYWKTGKKTGFDSNKILMDVARKIGMSKSAEYLKLQTLCRQFTEKFPAFINMLQKEEF